MSVSEQDVRHIAALARLELADARIDTLVTELNGILAHMDVLQAVEMSPAAGPEVSDASSARGTTLDASVAGLRSDTPGAVPLHRERESFAPAFRDGFFLVPRLATHE